MKAVVLHEHGGIDRLKYQDFPEPVCGDGEVLVKVGACSVNRLDIWVRKGLPGREVTFPHILGCDISGYLADHAEGISRGSRVVIYPGIHCGTCRFCTAGRENRCPSLSIIGGVSRWHGGYAEYVKVPVRNLIPLEDDLSMEEAASINVAYLTVYSMLRYALRVMEDLQSRVDDPYMLVYGAGSGIGVASIQLARAMGFRVIATVGSESKVEKAYSLGCDLVIDRKRQDTIKEVMNFTGNEGVDLVVDHAGIWDTSIKCLKRSGIVAACGATASEHTQVEIRPFYNKLAVMFGAYLGSKKEMVEMLGFMKEHRIRPVIDSVFALEDAMLAHARMEMDQHFGKIVLKI